MARIMRAIVFASATAATILGLRATSWASQRFGLPPLRTSHRITFMAPTISRRRMSVWPLFWPVSPTAPSRAFAGRSPPGHEPEPGGEVAAALEGAEVGREGGDGARRDRTDPGRRAETAEFGIRPRRRIQLVGQPLDHLGGTRDLLEAKRAHPPDRSWRIDLGLGESVFEHREAGRPLRRHEAELRQVAAQRIDQLGALPNEALVGPERHRAALRPGALDRHEPHGRARGGLRDRLGVGAVVLLPLHERLTGGARAQVV